MNDYFNFDQGRLIPGDVARAEDVNAVFDDIAMGLDKLPGVSQIFGGSQNYAVATGEQGNYNIEVPAITEYIDGMVVAFKASSDGGPSSLNINDIGARSVVANDGSQLVPGDIVAGHIYTVRYNVQSALDGSWEVQRETAGEYATNKVVAANIEDVKRVAANMEEVLEADANAATATAKAGEAATSATEAANSASAAAGSAAALPNAVAIGAGLIPKVNPTATGWEGYDLGNKADITYVDAELADKADITYVDAELADKADITYVDAELADKADITYVDAAIIALEDVPFAYQRGATLPSIKGYSVAADRAVLVWPRVRVVDHDTGIAHVIPVTELNINSPLVWDDGQYATAANRAGRNFCLYLLSDGTLLLSANSIAPIGHTTANSLKIGGFHCICVSVGTISGHRLSGFVAGDILPDSVWDLMHRPSCAPSGMVYSQEADIWVDIYLQSGTGANTASVYGATITNTRDWMDFVDDLAAVSKRLLSDAEFQIIASGSNEMTNIVESSDPITTGGHIDTAGRRMISNIGCEDCCGVLWQWTSEQSYATDSEDLDFYWFELPGGKGSLYKQGGTFGDVKLLAGGCWKDGADCGSRSRDAGNYRGDAYAVIGARGCARSHT